MASKSEGGDHIYNGNGIGDWIRKHHLANSQFSRSQSAEIGNPCVKNYFHRNHRVQPHPVGVPISVIRINNQLATREKIEAMADFSNFSDVSSSSSSREIRTINLESMNVRSPKCAQCQNHGRQVRIKNHKRYCPWKTCHCHKCLLTHDRRRVMASQVAVRRAQAQDNERIKELGIQFMNRSSKLKDTNLIHKNSVLSYSTYEDANDDRKKPGCSESLAESQTLSLRRHWEEGSSHITNLRHNDTGSTWFPPYKSGCYGSRQETRGGNGINLNILSGSSLSTLETEESKSPVAVSSSNELGEPVLSSSNEIRDVEQTPEKVPLSIYGSQRPERYTKLENIAISVKALRDVFQLPPESDYLIYRILKDYGGDFKQVSVKIFEAQCELKSWELLHQAALNIYAAN